MFLFICFIIFTIPPYVCLSLHCLYFSFQRKHAKSVASLTKKPASPKPNQRSMTDYNLQPVKLYDANHPRQISLGASLLKMISKDMLPVSIVEGEGFQEFVHDLEPKFKSPRRWTVRRKIVSRVDDEILPDIRTMVSKLSNGDIHTTSDLWETRMHDSILGVRIHFIDEHWRLNNHTIGLEQFSGRHTGVNIMAAFEKVLQNVGLYPHMLGYNMTDSAANMIKAFKVLNDSQEIPELECEDSLEAMFSEIADLEHLSVEEILSEYSDDESDFSDLDVFINRKSCNAHDLQNTNKDALKLSKPATKVISHCGKAVKFYNKSTRWGQVLKQRCGKSLIQANKIRWNSNLRMMARIAEVMHF